MTTATEAPRSRVRVVAPDDDVELLVDYLAFEARRGRPEVRAALMAVGLEHLDEVRARLAAR